MGVDHERGACNGPPIPMEDFSSRAHLTEETASKEDVSESVYDPFSERSIQHPNSDLGALMHLLKCSLGSGILAMPMAFKNAGTVVGFVGTVLTGILCMHCVYMLVRSSHTLCRRAGVPVLGFADTAEYAFLYGPEGLKVWAHFSRGFVNMALVVSYYSACCVYVIFVSTSIKQVCDVLFPWAVLDIRVYIAMLLLPLVPSCLVRNLKFLVPFSTAANLFIVVGFSCTLYYLFRDMKDASQLPMTQDVARFPLFFSTVVFAMEGIGMVMPVENTMKHPRHFLGWRGVFTIAMTIVILLYTFLGFFGYLAYGEDTEGSVTLNLPQEPLGQAVKILIGLAILFTYPLQFHVPTEIILRMVGNKVSRKLRDRFEYILRVSVVLLTVGVAAAVPQLGPVVSLVGAVCFSTLGLLCPAVIETATHWPCRWIAVKNSLIVILSLAALISGSYASILEIIEEFGS